MKLLHLRRKLNPFRRTPRIVLLLVLLGGLWGVWEAISWPDVKELASRNPRTSAFIERYKERQRERGGIPAVSWKRVSYSNIAPCLKRAVLVAEDVNFFSHNGFDLGEIQNSLLETFQEGERLRGASTVTQQLAKNLWLSPSLNPLRKVKEAILTCQLERHLKKRRILELYLNFVEFGEGIYGAEAAALHYFDKHASELDAHEAALLAASLPRPSSWNPRSRSLAYRRHVHRIEQRMTKATFLADSI